MSKFIKDHSLSLGYNNTGQEFFDILHKHERYIHSYYFSLVETMKGFGLDPEKTAETLGSCNTYNIPANILFNTKKSEERWDELIRMVKDKVNLQAVTVLTLNTAKKVRDKYPELKIHLSVRYWDWMIDPSCKLIVERNAEILKENIDVINISGCWSYNDHELCDIIHDLGIQTKFIVNEGCLNKRFINYMRFDEFNENKCYEKPCKMFCNEVISRYPWMKLTNISLFKESVKHHDYDILKISTREQPNDILEQVLEYWVSDDPSQMLKNITIHELNYSIFLEWIEVRSKCSNNCFECRRCEEYYNLFKCDEKEEPMSKYIRNHSLSLGYNNTGQEFFDLLHEYEPFIHSFYFSLTESIEGFLFDMDHEIDVLEHCNTYDIPANLLLTRESSEDHFEKTIEIAKRIVNLKAVTGYTPELCRKIKTKYPELEVHLTVKFSEAFIYDYDTHDKLIERVRDKGIDVINISLAKSYNDHELVRKLHELGMQVKAIINEECINRRAKNYHNFEDCKDLECGQCEVTGIKTCNTVVRRHPWMKLTKILLFKESMQYYNYDILKMSTRKVDNDNIRIMLNNWTNDDQPTQCIIHDLYLNERSYPIFLDWIKTKSTCSNDCYNCRKCEEYFNIMSNT